ncbi:hypothetical protein MLD38_037592 [Melastoma candidum]|uniref:Uncharacterized protein n=1 Tax=Melastoma candidum TaxID=119954 RepID=A0ACB9LPW1_9MYRT|nr:hypothetical protein MLD38_037592 [Melastoma candidum]
MSRASNSFGGGSSDRVNPFAAKPSFADASAFASKSPEFLFGRGSGPKYSAKKGTTPGQSATHAGSTPSSSFTGNHAFGGFSSAPSLGTSGFPRIGSLTTPLASGWVETMSGSTSGAPSTGAQFRSVSRNDAQSGFGAPGIGTRVTPYKVTELFEDKSFLKLHSISVMPAYMNKSHEELRWEDHGLENKGAPMGSLNPFRVDTAEHNPFLSFRTPSWTDMAARNPLSVGVQSTSAATMVSPSRSMITFPSIVLLRQPSPAVSSFSPPNTNSNIVPGIGFQVTPYMVTDLHENETFSRLHSISGIPAYSNKSHEELRWEVHRQGKQGAVTASLNIFSAESAEHGPFLSSGTSTWSNTASRNPFSIGTQNTAAATMVSPSPCVTRTTPSPFCMEASPSTFPSIAPPGQSFPAVSSFSPPNSTSNFFAPTTPANSSSSAKAAFLSPFNSSSTVQSSVSQPSLFSSSTTIPAPQQTTFPSFQPTTSAETSSQSSTISLLRPANPVELCQPSLSAAPAQSSLPPETNSSFNIGTPGQMLMTAGTCNANNIWTQPAAVTNPFGILPPVPKLSLDRSGTSQPIRYGISTSQMREKLASAQTLSRLTTNTSRGLLCRQLRLPVRKYKPGKIVSEVPFMFSNMDTGVAVPKAGAFFIPRENPRDLIIHPLPRIWTSRSEDEQSSPLNTASCVTGKIGTDQWRRQLCSRPIARQKSRH